MIRRAPISALFPYTTLFRSDIGVHQDGLIHISAMSEKRINDPREVVKPGQVVKVKVLDVDVPRNRISLTLRLSDPLPPKGDRKSTRLNSSHGYISYAVFCLR